MSSAKSAAVWSWSFVHAAGITLPKFIGYDSMPTLGFSLALSHLAVGSWLAAKGFAMRDEAIA
jgi:hypothetical protein